MSIEDEVTVLQYNLDVLGVKRVEEFSELTLWDRVSRIIEEKSSRFEKAEDLLNKIADKLNLPAGADLEGILPLLDEKLK